MMSVVKKICKNKVVMFVFVFMMCMTNVCAGNLWDGTGSQTAIQNFSTAYQHWFIPILGVSIALYSFTSNEKLKGYAKGLLIGVIIVFLITFGPVQSFIYNTLELVTGWFA